MLAYWKLPDSLSDCENLKYTKVNNCAKCQINTKNDDQKFIVENEVILHCNVAEYEQIRCEYNHVIKKIDAKDKLIHHMEGRINDQSDLTFYNNSTKNNFIQTRNLIKMEKAATSKANTTK